MLALTDRLAPRIRDPDYPGADLPRYEWDGDPGPTSVFTHGVASGDPLADSVILWTRISPDDPSAEVFFEVALDPEFGERVAADYLGTPDEARDNTIKLDLDGLAPATTYYYRFWVQGVASAIGRTRTAPDGASDHLTRGQDGRVCHVPASTTNLTAAIIAADGSLVAGPGLVGEMPIMGGGAVGQPDSMLTICTNGHTWVCDAYETSCSDFAPSDGDKMACGCCLLAEVRS